MTPIQYLDFWMRSVYTYTKENTSKSKNRLEQKSPPIFIVGTHRDSVGGADLPDRERKKLVSNYAERCCNFSRMEQGLKLWCCQSMDSGPKCDTL